MVSDIEKLRPELLTKSIAELERQQNELALAIAHKHREAELAEKQELADRANGHIEAVNAGVKFLHDNGVLPARIAAGFTRESDGMFSPSMFLRAVTAESFLTSTLRGGGKPKRTRRTKAEIEALKASGEYKPRRRRA